MGFARGYQSRWTNAYGQHFGTRATKSSDGRGLQRGDSEAGFSQETQVRRTARMMRINRRIFEDDVEIVVKAWTQESFEHNGPAWQVPYPL